MGTCIVCEAQGAHETPGTEGNIFFTRFTCQRCGVFVLSDGAMRSLQRDVRDIPIRRSLMSHVLRRMQASGGMSSRLIDADQLDSFWRQEKLPSALQQVDNLILWIGDRQDTLLSTAEATPTEIAATIGLPISAGDSQGFAWLNTQLEPRGLYQIDSNRPAGKVALKLSLAGWERFQELKKAQIESRTAFMAMKFGLSAVQEAVDQCFRAAVQRTGFELRVLTDQQGAGSIDS
jgi:hypothetical protein